MASISGSLSVRDAVSISSITSLSVTAILVILATVSVGVRFLSRQLTSRIRWDDWLSLCALFFFFGELICIVSLFVVRTSSHAPTVFDQTSTKTLLQIMLANSIIYETCLACSRLSLLMLYYRIFNAKSLRVIVQISCTIVIAIWISSLARLIFAFKPIQAQWQPWLPHTNIAIHASNIAGGVIGTVVDFTILILPQLYIWKLQHSLQRKVQLLVLSLVGLTTCIASMIRVIYIARSGQSVATELHGICAAVESGLAIICSCAPAIPALINHLSDDSEMSDSDNSCLSQCGSISSWRRLISRRRGSESEDISRPHHTAAMARANDKSLPYSSPIRVHTEIEVRVERIIDDEDNRHGRSDW